MILRYEYYDQQESTKKLYAFEKSASIYSAYIREKSNIIVILHLFVPYPDYTNYH